MSRGMQNLTAKYNYLYNANELLHAYEANLQAQFPFNNDTLLPLYISPTLTTMETPALDNIISKAQLIIAEKSYSNYIAESYLLLAKAHYLKGNYFLANEYYNYVAHSYINDASLLNQALNGKARSLMQLEQATQATLVLDTLEASLHFIKKEKAASFATLTQYHIQKQEYQQSISYLQSALAAHPEQHQRILWQYVLAQLYEKEQNYSRALQLYSKVQRSNAPFDLHFLSRLNAIRIKGLIDASYDSKQAMENLIDDDKNTDHLDQLYHRLAQVSIDEGDIGRALSYLHKATVNSTTNIHQKSLSYLKLADLNFKSLKNYEQAELYYDSTLTILPLNYTEYETVLKNRRHASALAGYFRKIAQEDGEHTTSSTIPVSAVQQPELSPFTPVNSSGTAFYFNNAAAVSKGYADFKRQWGNRVLEDHWRQSVRTGAPSIENRSLPADPDGEAPELPTAIVQPQQERTSAPLTPALRDASNKRILEAYDQIRIYLLLEMKDQDEAKNIEQLIAARFPDSEYAKGIATPAAASGRDAYTAFEKKNFQTYINANKERRAAMSDVDEPENALKKPAPQHITLVQTVKKKEDNTHAEKKPPGSELFSDSTAGVYYFVIDVADATVTLSSSRFGIGQFNRGNYAEYTLKHQLKEIDNDQLIYVGNFSNFGDVKTYADAVTPLLPTMMKVPEHSYTSFIISKENFDKIKNKELINRYLDFYKKYNLK